MWLDKRARCGERIEGFAEPWWTLGRFASRDLVEGVDDNRARQWSTEKERA